MILRRTFLLITIVTLLVAPRPAGAQISRVGATFNIFTAPTRGSSIAYDAKNDVYLTVSAAGLLRGRFVNADGTPLASAFVIQASANYTHFPRVAYSPDADAGAGGFLVTWHESEGSVAVIHWRIVSITHGLVSADTRVAGTASFWEVGAAVSYSTVSQEFLVVWRSFSPADIQGVRVNTAGAVVSAVFSIAATAGFEDNPNVAYNPDTNEFLVVYGSYTTFSTLYGQRVKPGSGQLLGGPATIAQGAGIYITDVAYNPLTGHFLAAWYLDSGQVKAIYGRLLNSDGTTAGEVTPLSTRYRAYDGLSLAHNTTSGTFFAISHDSIAAEDGGVEIDGSATPLTTGVQVTAQGGLGNFYPRIASHAARPEWIAVAAASFSATIGQRIQSASRSGGTGIPPHPTVPNPRMAIDLPRTNASIAGAVTLAGWALDLGAPSGSGVDTVHVWAFPASGAPFFVGAATMGDGRPDVGAAFGSAQFSTSGFHLTANLPSGSYDLGAYAHSTVTNTFTIAQSVHIQVTAPQSIPLMAVDFPAQNQNVSQNFVVAGWALDLAASSGTGVDAVVVWAYPISGEPPQFVGVTTLGTFSRTDVGAAFGSSRFSASGYDLTVSGTLARGSYDLVVFAHSAVANAYNNALAVRITVR